MFLFAGLGNPGAQYASNRHNIGFMAADVIHRRHSLSPWRKKFQGALSEGTLAGEKVLLLKPQTFMNESGRSVGEAVRFHDIPLENVYVFYDELDLGPGKVRVRLGVAPRDITGSVRSLLISRQSSSVCGWASAIQATRTSCSRMYWVTLPPPTVTGC